MYVGTERQDYIIIFCIIILYQITSPFQILLDVFYFQLTTK